MHNFRAQIVPVPLALIAILVAGCGGSGSKVGASGGTVGDAGKSGSGGDGAGNESGRDAASTASDGKFSAGDGGGAGSDGTGSLGDGGAGSGSDEDMNVGGGAGDGSATGSDGSASAGDGGALMTTIRIHYPAAGHSVVVRGSDGGLNWNQGLSTVAGADDTYTFSSTTITARTEWKPLLDDSTWSRGPNYIVLPGQSIDIYPHFTSTSGHYEVLIPSFHSQYLPDDRKVWVYYPTSYDENARARFPVLYMQDGQNLFDASLAFGGNEWMVDETLDAGAEAMDEADSIRESIVIGPENTAARIYEYTPVYDASEGDGGGADKYLDLLAMELKPMVDSMLRTDEGVADTAIIGSSLGGLLAAHAGVSRPDVYGLVGALSPSTWWDNTEILSEVATVKTQTLRALTVYVDSGDSGPSNDDVTNTDLLAQTYVDSGYTLGVNLEHVVQAGGQHSEIYWAQRFPGAAHFLVGARAYTF